MTVTDRPTGDVTAHLPPGPVPEAPLARVRLDGLDAARALALMGMIAVHTRPVAEQGAVTDMLLRATYGRASLLFVLLAGVGVGLLVASRPGARGTLAWRALLLLPAGLALQSLDHGASIILPTYAALFLLALVLVRAPTWALLATGVAAGTLGSVGWLLARGSPPFEMAPAQLGESVHEIVSAIVLTGPYPLITWVGPFSLGIALSRADLTSPVVRHRLMIWGGAAAVLGLTSSAILMAVLGAPDSGSTWGRLVAASGHSQMPLWFLSGLGAAAAVLGASLMLLRRPHAATAPLVALGRLSLTVYVLHLVVLGTLIRPHPSTQGESLLVLTSMIGVALLAAWLWRRRFRSGPLEWALRTSQPRLLGGRA